MKRHEQEQMDALAERLREISRRAESGMTTLRDAHELQAIASILIRETVDSTLTGLYSEPSTDGQGRKQ